MPIDWKALTDQQINYLIGGESLRTPPMRHQSITMAMAASVNRMFAWNDIGTGKSYVGLGCHKIWRSRRILVVCPNRVVEGWREQIGLHTDWTAEFLIGPVASRREIVESSPAKVFVINYEGLQYLFGRRVVISRQFIDDEERLERWWLRSPFCCRFGGFKTFMEDWLGFGPKDSKTGRYGHWKEKTAWRLDRDAVRRAGFDGLVIDEAHHVADEKSHQTKVCRVLSEYASNVLLLSGTPTATNKADGQRQLDPSIWGMYDVLDGGRTLGVSKWNFLKQHYKRTFFGTWVLKSGEEDKILQRVSPVTIRFSREECFDLPPKTYEDRYADLSPEQIRLIDRVIGQEALVFPEGVLSAKDASCLGTKLCQISGGFLNLDNGAVHRLKTNPKLGLLMEVLEEVGRAVIFHSYVAEGHMICEELARRSIKHEAMRGDVKDQLGWKRFRDDPSISYLVAHPAAGGEGLNLQTVPVMVFYNNGMTGARIRAQAEGRIWRAGQKEACVYLDLILRNSVDEQRIQNAKDAAEAANRIHKYIELRKAQK